MPLLNLILVLVILGVVLYLINTYIPMQAPVKTVLNAIVVIALCLWLLSLLGFGNIMIPLHK
jgi:hypothetical protein